jgi:maltooligosyltrehalose trehalohydrolase
VLDGYRQLAALRTELEALTDPHYARNAVEADEQTRVLRLTRRAGMPDAVEIVLNLGTEPQTVPVTRTDLRFATHPDVALADALTLPPGSGALLA